jgi:hypothetical protein
MIELSFQFQFLSLAVCIARIPRAHTTAAMRHENSCRVLFRFNVRVLARGENVAKLHTQPTTRHPPLTMLSLSLSFNAMYS